VRFKFKILEEVLSYFKEIESIQRCVAAVADLFDNFFIVFNRLSFSFNLVIRFVCTINFGCRCVPNCSELAVG
jgi:hypothetical protein